MTIPVLHSFRNSFPQVKMTVLTKAQFAPLFNSVDINLLIADTKGEHKGFPGLWRLYKQIRSIHEPDAIADLHNVLRSKLLRLFFSFSNVKIAVLDKKRDEMNQLVRKKNKVLTPLPSRYERYQQVFKELGFDFTLRFHSIFPVGQTLRDEIVKCTGQKKNFWIGIAPFAAFQPKIYPAGKMKLVIQALLNDPSNKIFFFGGGKEETSLLAEWETEFVNTVSIAGKLSLADELILMSHLDVMVAMDSANMHFAALTSTPVVSIWGATHPAAGFTPWGQPANQQVQIDLYCRPCSVYGNVPCYRGDHACMHDLPEKMILDKILEIKNLNVSRPGHYK